MINKIITYNNEIYILDKESKDCGCDDCDLYVFENGIGNRVCRGVRVNINCGKYIYRKLSNLRKEKIEKIYGKSDI